MPLEDVEVEEEEEEVATESGAVLESSAKNIRALLAIVRMLVESGKVRRGITSDDIQCVAFRGTVFTEREGRVRKDCQFPSTFRPTAHG